MNLISNIIGTLSNIFSLGKGSDKVDIRTNSGILQGRDNGGSYKPLININDAITSLSYTWSSQKITDAITSGNPNRSITDAELGTSQGLVDGVRTKLNLDTAIRDTQSEFDIVNHRWVSKTNQEIHMTGTCTFTDLRNLKGCGLYLYKNGVYVADMDSVSYSSHGHMSLNLSLNLSFYTNVSTNDYIELYAIHHSGGTCTVGEACLQIRTY